MNQIGRAIPRLEARAKVTGRAEYVHNLRVPGMLYREDFPQHGRAWPHPLHRRETPARDAEGVYAVVTGEDIQSSFPSPYFGPAFHDQPILALDKVRYVGEAGRCRARRRSACRRTRGAVDLRRLRRTGAGVRRGRGHRPPRPSCMTTLKPAGTFADLKHLAGRKNTNVALDYQLRRGDVEQGLRGRRPCVRARIQDASNACTCRSNPMSLSPIPGDGSLTLHSSDPDAVLRAHGDRAAVGLARKPRAREGAVPRRRLRREGLCEGWKRSPRHWLSRCAAPVKIALTMEEQFYTITKHAHDVPHQKRHHQGRPRRRARMRCLLERRRLCGYRTARRAEIGLHRRGSLRYRELCGSTRTRCTPTVRPRARCAASAFRSLSGRMNATPI